jgi:cytochrome c553
MRRTPLKTAAFALALGCGLAVALGFAASSADEEPPYWAFTIGSYMTEARNHHPGDQLPLAVPNSDVILSRAQTIDIFKVPDWHPDEHPKPPSVVMYGRKPGVYSCAYCHMPNGMGIPESAALAGLPADYIIRQVKAFKSGDRSTVKPDMISYRGMASIAKVITDDELQAAAAYFSSLKPKPWITVIETDVVPKTHADQYTLFSNHDGQSEPIGDRVIEIPKDDYLYDLHDSGSGFIAYVPTGSIKRGELIATTGDNGRIQACVSCHGPDLRGTAIAPPIAGRGPSNIVRQLYNIQHGARNGLSVMPMKSVVAPLTQADMVSIAAYVSSRKP